MRSNSVPVLVAVALLGSGCGGSTAPSTAAGDAASRHPVVNPAPVAPVVASSPQMSAAEAPNEVSSHMDDHFAAVRDIERAAVAGNLDAMRERAAWLAEHEPEDSMAYKPELDEMRTKARQLARALDLQAAIPLAAELGAACGSCHQTMTTITSFEFQELPKDTGDLDKRMVRHLWAVDRLWEGMVGPSAALWQSGADVLAEAPVPVKDIASDPSAVREVTRLANQLQRLGQLARKASDQQARTVIYGELLTTCAACHDYSTPVGKRTPRAPLR